MISLGQNAPGTIAHKTSSAEGAIHFFNAAVAWQGRRRG
jgi:hypothetical protein